METYSSKDFISFSVQKKNKKNKKTKNKKKKKKKKTKHKKKKKQKNGSPTSVTSFKIALQMADPFSLAKKKKLVPLTHHTSNFFSSSNIPLKMKTDNIMY